MNTTQCNRRSNCRLCNFGELELVIKLTPTPPANAFVEGNRVEVEQSIFPLDVFFCKNCSHVQLLDVIDPKILFSEYVYVSGRGDGHIHVFSAINGDYLNSQSLGNTSMLGGLTIEKKGLPNLGDLNNNNLFNIVDIVALVQIVLNPMMADPYPNYASDLNVDEIVNVADIIGLVSIVLEN